MIQEAKIKADLAQRLFLKEKSNSTVLALNTTSPAVYALKNEYFGACILLPNFVLETLISTSCSTKNHPNLPKGLIKVSPKGETPKETPIRISLLYKTSEDITGEPLYKNSQRAFLRPETLEGLRHANKFLEPYGVGLVLLDAWRPPIAAARLWNKAVELDLKNFFAPPQISGHCRGLSVDVTLYKKSSSKTDRTVEMPSLPDQFFKEKDKMIPTKIQTDNSQLLWRAMRHAGFRRHPKEWWHFDFNYNPKDSNKFPIVDDPKEKRRIIYDRNTSL